LGKHSFVTDFPFTTVEGDAPTQGEGAGANAGKLKKNL